MAEDAPRGNGAKRKRSAQALRARRAGAPNGKPQEHPRAARRAGPAPASCLYGVSARPAA